MLMARVIENSTKNEKNSIHCTCIIMQKTPKQALSIAALVALKINII